MEGFEVLEQKFLKQVKNGWNEVKEEDLKNSGFSEYYPEFQLPDSIVLIKGRLI